MHMNTLHQIINNLAKYRYLQEELVAFVYFSDYRIKEKKQIGTPASLYACIHLSSIEYL